MLLWIYVSTNYTFFLYRQRINIFNHSLTVIHDVFAPVEPSASILQVLLGHVDGPDDALIPQVPHEELQSNQSEDTETEDGQDHHVRQLLHRLDQSTYDGL